MRSCRGFTLLEIMLVVIIIAVLSAIVMPSLGGRSEQAKVARAKADLANIGAAAGLYELDLGAYPPSVEAMTSNTSSSSDWNGPYLDNEPTDPWGRPYRYQAPGQHNPNKFDLNSLGRDGLESEDDVTNWKKDVKAA